MHQKAHTLRRHYRGTRKLRDFYLWLRPALFGFICLMGFLPRHLAVAAAKSAKLPIPTAAQLQSATLALEKFYENNPNYGGGYTPGPGIIYADPLGVFYYFRYRPGINPALRYLTCEIAINALATNIQANYQIGQLLEAMRSLENHFAVNPNALHQHIARIIANYPPFAGVVPSCVMQIIRWSYLAVFQRHYTRAADLLNSASRLAPNAGNPMLVRLVNYQQSKVRQLKNTYNHLRVQRRLLVNHPNNAKASRLVGLFDRIIARTGAQRKHADRLLMRSGNATLRSLVKLDDLPVLTPRQNLKAGDLWWIVAAGQHARFMHLAVRRLAKDDYCFAIAGMNNQITGMLARHQVEDLPPLLVDAIHANKRLHLRMFDTIAAPWNPLAAQIAAQLKLYKQLPAKDGDRHAADHLVAGEFLCLISGHFRQGLPELAQGSDPDLAGVAKRDLARPQTRIAERKLGDAWWKLQSRFTALMRWNIERRAIYWLQQAAAASHGAKKSALESRIALMRQVQP